ncbi:MAG: hypothetical protein H6Q76_1471 [Firmicutes bacterium]|nr:hypothetical protein [Bacillota bacterium]
MVLNDLLSMFNDADTSTFDINSSPFFCVRKQPDYAQKVCADFEKKYGVPSSDFEKKYQSGTIPSEIPGEDAFYWMHQIQILSRLKVPAGFMPGIADTWKEEISPSFESEDWTKQKGGNASLYCFK